MKNSDYVEGFQEALELTRAVIEKIMKAVVDKKLEQVKKELGLTI